MKDIILESSTFGVLEQIEKAKEINGDFLRSLFPNLTVEEFQNFLRENEIREDEDTNKIIGYLRDSQGFSVETHKIRGNRASIIEAIAISAGLSTVMAGRALQVITSTISRILRDEQKITLPGLGTFSVSKRSARSGRNPQTGAVIKIKAKKVAKFKPAKKLSEKIK